MQTPNLISPLKSRIDSEQTFLQIYELYNQQQKGLCQMLGMLQYINKQFEIKRQFSQHLNTNFNQLLLAQQHSNIFNNNKLFILINKLRQDDLFRPNVLMKTLDFINKVLESNFDVELKLQQMDVDTQQLKKIKLFNKDIKEYVGRNILPGQKINIEKILDTILNRRMKHFSSIIEDCLQINNYMSQNSSFLEHEIEIKNIKQSFTSHLNFIRSKKVENTRARYQTFEDKYMTLTTIENNSQESIEKTQKPKYQRPMSATTQKLSEFVKLKTNYYDNPKLINFTIPLKSPRQTVQMINMANLVLKESKNHPSKSAMSSLRPSSRKQLSSNFFQTKKEKTQQTQQNVSSGSKQIELYTQLMKQNQKIQETQKKFHDEFKSWAKIKFNTKNEITCDADTRTDLAWLRFTNKCNIRLNLLLYSQGQT